MEFELIEPSAGTATIWVFYWVAPYDSYKKIIRSTQKACRLSRSTTKQQTRFVFLCPRPRGLPCMTTTWSTSVLRASTHNFCQGTSHTYFKIFEKRTPWSSRDLCSYISENEPWHSVRHSTHISQKFGT
jgi:hypothetical protein